MIYLVYIKDRMNPSDEPFLVGVADCKAALNKMQLQALSRFSWLADPDFIIHEGVTNQLLD